MNESANVISVLTLETFAGSQEEACGNSFCIWISGCACYGSGELLHKMMLFPVTKCLSIFCLTFS